MNSKILDLICIKNLEVIITIILSITTLIILCRLNVHANWLEYEPMFKSIVLAIFQSFIGLIGIIIAGVAVIISVFTRDVLRVMRKQELVDNLKPIFYSFVFLAQITVVGVVIFLFAYIFSHSKIYIPAWSFYTIAFIATYILYFVILYTVSLIHNIVSIFFITSKFNKGLDEEESLLLEKAIYFVDKQTKSDFFSSNEILLNVIRDDKIEPDLKIEIIKILMK